MIIDDQARSSFAGFGAFGSADDKWCDDAANTWAQVTGDSATAEDYRKKCKGMVFFANPSWDVSKVGAGLPLNFSTDPNKVRAGVGGAITGLIKDVGATVGPMVNPPAAPPPAVNTPPAPVVTPQTPPSSTNWNGNGNGSGGGWLPGSQYIPSPSSNTALYVGGALALAAAAVLVFKKKSSGGFSGYSRRRSRRSRR